MKQAFTVGGGWNEVISVGRFNPFAVESAPNHHRAILPNVPVDHYENFPVASLLLPRQLRRPIETIYRFARAADDIADEGGAAAVERLQALAVYRDEIERIASARPPVRAEFSALSQVIAEWRLPPELFLALLDAFAQDVRQTRYADFAQLLDYCRRSANPVGRLLLHLVDRCGDEELRRSDCICTALQLVNFWQDIAIDWRKGRVYLPQEDLQRFAIDEGQIAAGVWSERWAALLAFEIARTRQLMLDGAPLVHRLPGRLGWEIRLTVQGGLRILERIAAVRGDVFQQRPVLRLADWLRIGQRAVGMSFV